jgi:hypothetical protein
MLRIDRCISPGRRAATVVAALALVACAQQPQRARPAVVSLGSAKNAIDTVNLVLARTRGDTEYDTLPGVGDEQRLMVGTCPGRCAHGPRAKIQPHRAAAYLTQADRDSGVVIARIINLSDTAYEKFNLHARDTVYWRVVTLGGRDVSLFVSSAPGVRALRSDLRIDEYHPTTYRQALARWIWDDNDEIAWGTCDGGHCCRSSGTPL